MRREETWHGLDGTHAISGLVGDEGWFFEEGEGIRANREYPPGPATAKCLDEIRAKAEAGSEFHQRALMAHLKARLLT